MLIAKAFCMFGNVQMLSWQKWLDHLFSGWLPWQWLIFVEFASVSMKLTRNRCKFFFAKKCKVQFSDRNHTYNNLQFTRCLVSAFGPPLSLRIMQPVIFTANQVGWSGLRLIAVAMLTLLCCCLGCCFAGCNMILDGACWVAKQLYGKAKGKNSGLQEPDQWKKK